MAKSNLKLFFPSQWDLLTVFSFYALAAFVGDALGLNRSPKALLVWAIPGTIHLWWDIEAFHYSRLPLILNIAIVLGIFYSSAYGLSVLGRNSGWGDLTVIFIISMAAVMILNKAVRRKRSPPVLQIDLNAIGEERESIETVVASAEAKPSEDPYMQRLSTADLPSVRQYLGTLLSRIHGQVAWMRYPEILARPFLRPLSLVLAQRRSQALENCGYAWLLLISFVGISTLFMTTTGLGFQWIIIIEMVALLPLGYVIVFIAQANAGVPPHVLGPLIAVLSAVVVVRLLQGSTIEGMMLLGAIAGDSCALGGEVNVDRPEPPTQGRPWAAGLAVVFSLVLIGTLIGNRLGQEVTRSIFRLVLLFIVVGICCSSTIVFGFGREGKTRSHGLFLILVLSGALGLLLIGTAKSVIVSKEMAAFLLSSAFGYAGSTISLIAAIRAMHRHKIRFGFHLVRGLGVVRAAMKQVMGIGVALTVYCKAALGFSYQRSLLIGLGIMILYASLTFRLPSWVLATISLWVIKAARAFVPTGTTARTNWGFSRRIVFKHAQALFIPLPQVATMVQSLGREEGVLAGLKALRTYAGFAIESSTVARSFILLAHKGDDTCTVMQWAYSHNLIEELMRAGHKSIALRAATRLCVLVSNITADPYERVSILSIRSKGRTYKIESKRIISNEKLLSRIHEDLALAASHNCETIELTSIFGMIRSIENAESSRSLAALAQEFGALADRSRFVDTPNAVKAVENSLERLQSLLAQVAERRQQRLIMDERAWLYDRIREVDEANAEGSGSFALSVIGLLLQRAKNLLT